MSKLNTHLTILIEELKMLYRIDFEHFLVHAIDHFTRVELNSFHYVIISAGIVNTGKAINVVKINTLFL